MWFVDASLVFQDSNHSAQHSTRWRSKTLLLEDKRAVEIKTKSEISSESYIRKEMVCSLERFLVLLRP